MAIKIQRLWREPLVHFLAIGAGLFLFYDVTQQGASEAPNRIRVTSTHQEQLAANFKRTWMRSPTQEELNDLVERYVREEVFYREALAMGLDRDDPIVRQRMQMKLEIIIEDLSTDEVSDKVLANFLQQHRDRFRIEPQVSFQQVYLNPVNREDLETDAKHLQERLKGGTAPQTLGDPSMAPHQFRLASQSEIARSYGERFAQELVKLEPGEWTGPVYSPLGGHLIKISQTVAARLPELGEIRELVMREYLVQRRDKQKEQAYQRLREGYEITVDAPSSEPGDAGTSVAMVYVGERQE